MEPMRAVRLFFVIFLLTLTLFPSDGEARSLKRYLRHRAKLNAKYGIDPMMGPRILMRGLMGGYMLGTMRYRPYAHDRIPLSLTLSLGKKSDKKYEEPTETVVKEVVEGEDDDDEDSTVETVETSDVKEGDDEYETEEEEYDSDEPVKEVIIARVPEEKLPSLSKLMAKSGLSDEHKSPEIDIESLLASRNPDFLSKLTEIDLSEKLAAAASMRSPKRVIIDESIKKRDEIESMQELSSSPVLTNLTVTGNLTVNTANEPANATKSVEPKSVNKTESPEIKTSESISSEKYALGHESYMEPDSSNAEYLTQLKQALKLAALQSALEQESILKSKKSDKSFIIYKTTLNDDDEENGGDDLVKKVLKKKTKKRKTSIKPVIYQRAAAVDTRKATAKLLRELAQDLNQGASDTTPEIVLKPSMTAPILPPYLPSPGVVSLRAEPLFYPPKRAFLYPQMMSSRFMPKITVFPPPLLPPSGINGFSMQPLTSPIISHGGLHTLGSSLTPIAVAPPTPTSASSNPASKGFYFSKTFQIPLL